MKKFNWKLAKVNLTKTFIVTFLTPLTGTQLYLQPEFVESVYVGLISSGIMTGIAFVVILERYMKFLQEQDNNAN